MATKKSIIESILLGIAAIIGIAGLIYATRWGAWAFSDSAAYVSSARSLIARHGLGYIDPTGQFDPLVRFPPLFPVLLASGGLIGVDPLVMARWLNLLAFALVIFSTGWWIKRLTGSLLLAIGGQTLFLFSIVPIMVFSGAMSEPVCIATGMLGLFLLIAYFKQQQNHYLFISALLVSLSFLTRYIGVAYLLAALVCILFLIRTPWLRRVKLLLVYGASASLPMVVWLAFAFTQTQTVGARTLHTSLNLWSSVHEFFTLALQVLATWVPYGSRFNWVLSLVGKLIVILAVILLIGVATWLKSRRAQPPVGQDDLTLSLVFWIFIVVYFFSLLLSFVFSVPAPAIDNRMFSPIYAALMPATMGWMGYLMKTWRFKWVWEVVVIVLLAVTLFFDYPATIETLASLNQTGYGYTTQEWHSSGIFAAIQKLPPSTPLISNEPALVLLYTDRFPYDVNDLFPRYRGDPIPPLGSGHTDLDTLMRSKGAVLIAFPEYFDLEHGNKSLQLQQQLTAGLKAIYSDNYGQLYVVP
jgi:4-amino-4-deoxy-L-arabinose transferase-like glycosyltransferase